MPEKDRITLIAGNWKMNKLVAEAKKLAIEVKNQTINLSESVEIAICPPFTALLAVYEVLGGSPIRLGAQNCYWENSGAYTGEISPLMLKEIGCRYVIVGHSERRSIFGETDEMVCKKAKALLDAEISPIVCVGENLNQREAGVTRDIVRGQIIGSLRGIERENMVNTVIAYEPVWAIGTGRTATPEQAQEVHEFIRDLLTGIYGLEVALRVRILYGGSVKADNIEALICKNDVDGALVGGASLDGSQFAMIVRNASKGARRC